MIRLFYRKIGSPPNSRLLQPRWAIVAIDCPVKNTLQAIDLISYLFTHTCQRLPVSGRSPPVIVHQINVLRVRLKPSFCPIFQSISVDVPVNLTALRKSDAVTCREWRFTNMPESITRTVGRGLFTNRITRGKYCRRLLTCPPGYEPVQLLLTNRRKNQLLIQYNQHLSSRVAFRDVNQWFHIAAVTAQ